MKNIDRRLSKLENRVRVAGTVPRIVVTFTDRELKNVRDSYLKILDEAGFLPSVGIGMVDFSLIPRGLNAEEEVEFVRENAAVICGSYPGCR